MSTVLKRGSPSAAPPSLPPPIGSGAPHPHEPDQTVNQGERSEESP